MVSRRLRPVQYNDADIAFVDSVFARFCQSQRDVICLDLANLMRLDANSSSRNGHFLRNYLLSATSQTGVFVLKLHNFVELFPKSVSFEIRHCALDAVMFELMVQSLRM